MRRVVLIGVVVLTVLLLALANALAVNTLDLFAEDAGGFVAFVNAIGILALTAVGVGVVIAWRVSDNRIGPLLIVGALLTEGVFVAWPLTVLAHAGGWLPPLLVGVIAWWASVSLLPGLFIMLPTVGLLFPTGELPGPRWRAPYGFIVAALVAGIVLVTIAPWTTSVEQRVQNPFALPGVPTIVSELGGAIAAAAVFLGFALAVTGMAVRFRGSRGAKRAQMKWLIAAVAVMGIVFPISFATDIGPAGLIDLASVLVGALMPLAIGIAILRYRLYDIDRIISRTLGWALVTGTLVALFITLVVGLQAILAEVTQGQTLAVAASTLIAAALFQPIRGRVHRAVDRRFDRHRYDGEQTAAAFADRLRDQVDLDELETDIATTVTSVLRPTAVGVWIRTVTATEMIGGS